MNQETCSQECFPALPPGDAEDLRPPPAQPQQRQRLDVLQGLRKLQAQAQEQQMD